MSLSRRRFLQLSAAGAASIPLASRADDYGLPVPNPYGHKNQVANLPAWDGGTSCDSVPGSMRMFRGNLTHSYYGSGTLSENLRLVWKFRTLDFHTKFRDQPHVWTGCGWTGQALVYGDYVFAGTTGGHFHCWEKMTGKLVWVFTAKRMFKSSPSLYKNRIYVGNVDNYLRCIDASTGQKIWDWYGQNDMDSSPRIWNDKVYVGVENGDFNCFDPETGKLQWSYELGEGCCDEPGSTGIESSVAIADGIGYFGHLDGYERAYDLTKRKLVWKTLLGMDVDASALILGDKLYVGVEEKSTKTFYCLDRENGKVIWSAAIPAGVWSSAAHHGKNVYVGGNDGRMYCFDAATGKEVWTFKGGAGIWSSPSIVDGKVVYGSYDKYYRMLDAETGALIWKYDIEERTHAGAAIEGGYVWVGGASGYFYCFGP